MKFIKNKKGTVFMTAIIISTLMLLIGVGLANVILQDTHMIKHLRKTTKAQLIAESGISDALATIISLGATSMSVSSNFPLTSFGGGTYDVTVTTSGNRVLLTSIGVYDTVSRTSALEVKDMTPTALYYMMAAGSVLRLRAFFLSLVDINGDLHANDDVRLTARALGLIDVDPCTDPSLNCDGDVSATDRVFLSTGWFAAINIAGTVTEGADLVTFPSFNYALYQTEATAAGDYYSGDKTFGSPGATTNLQPTNGIIYVEGTCRMYGTINLYGGMVADRIRVFGRLNQIKTGTKNVVISRTNDIEIFYRFDAEEAIVYAGRDFNVLSAGSYISVTGNLLAYRDIRVWDFFATVIYNHRLLSPDGLTIGSGGYFLEILNWTR